MYNDKPKCTQPVESQYNPKELANTFMGTEATSKPNEIPSMLEDINAKLIGLEKDIAILRDKINPILDQRESPPCPEKMCKEVEIFTPLGKDLLGIKNHANQLRNMIGDMIEKVKL